MCVNSFFLHRCPDAWATCCTWWTCRCPPPACRPLQRSPGTAHQRLAPLLTATVRRWWQVQENLMSSNPRNTFTRQKITPLHLPAARQPERHWHCVLTVKSAPVATPGLLLQQCWICLHNDLLDWIWFLMDFHLHKFTLVSGFCLIFAFVFFHISVHFLLTTSWPDCGLKLILRKENNKTIKWSNLFFQFILVALNFMCLPFWSCYL